VSCQLKILPDLPFIGPGSQIAVMDWPSHVKPFLILNNYGGFNCDATFQPRHNLKCVTLLAYATEGVSYNQF
jgi:hypothetical protein